MSRPVIAQDQQIATPAVAASTREAHRLSLVVACAFVFLIASGVRLLHWQDSHLTAGLGSLTYRYLKHAEMTLEGEGILFPRDYNEPTNVQLLVHPPGYSIFVAGIFGLFSKSRNAITVAQIIADGAAAAMVVIIAAELFPLAVGLLAGLLVAFSPHLAHYSLFLLPDSVSALPVLIAIYFIARSLTRPRLVSLIAAGFFIGLSCWLRSNALLLAPFVGVCAWLLFDRGSRLRYSVALIVSAMITISPITIRNWLVFDRFIPLSLGAGVTMIEGIADYDKQDRFGMPVSDLEAKHKDVEWHNRPDYGEGLWKPDGIDRDRYRFRRGIEVIRSNPVWFAGVMIHRAGFMLRYNNPTSEGWPFDTARVPVVALEPSYGHDLSVPPTSTPVWTISAAEFEATGNQLAAQADTRLLADGKVLELAGDASAFDDQLASAPIAVDAHTDYLLHFPARLVRGRVAAKVTSIDRRIALASALILAPDRKVKEEPLDDGEGAANSINDDSFAADDAADRLEAVFAMPFATGNRTEVLLVISNDGASSSRPAVQIGQPKLYRAGTTPHSWTSLIRPPIRAIQRNLYVTSSMLALVVTGILLAAVTRRRAAMLLVIVPIYYLSIQSAFHTEYRYILAIHYCLFVFAAVTLFCAGKLIRQGTLEIVKTLRRGRSNSSL